MATLKVPVSPEDHILGNENAPLILVEYGDYQCPYCHMAYFVVKELQKHFGDQLQCVFRNFPLTEVHPYSGIAADTAEFAGVHRRFWNMHDLIYENQNILGPEMLFSLTESLGLSRMDLEQAIQSNKFAQRIKDDFLGGVRSGVNGTPTFFINGTRHNGPFDVESLSRALNVALQEKMETKR